MTPTPHPEPQPPVPTPTRPASDLSPAEADEVERRLREQSLSENVVAKLEPPPAPTNLSVSGSTATSVSLTWTGATGFGILHFRVQYKISSVSTWTNSGASTTNSYTVTGLTCYTSYDFRVRAFGDGVVFDAVWSQPSATVSRTPVCPTAPPPENFSASPGATSVSLSWDAVTDAARYMVQRYDGSSWQFLSYSTGTSHNDTDLVCNKTYYYRVKTRGDGYPYSTTYGSASGFVSAKTTAVCPDAPPPDNLSAAINADETTVTLTWDQVPDSVFYKVQQLSNGSWIFSAYKYPTETDYDYTPAGGLSCGTTYTFRVSTRGDGSPWSTTYGNTTEASDTTSACPIPTAPPPENFSASPGETSVNLSWDAVTDAEKYQVQRLNGSWQDHVERTHTQLFYNDTGLVCNKTYSYRVKTRGDGDPYSTDYGAASSEASATTTAVCPDAPAPDNLSATIDADETSVTLTWDQVPDSASYKVQQLSSGSWVLRAYNDRTETTYTYTPTGGLSCGTTYTFRVSTRGDGSPLSNNYGNTTEASAPTSACPPNVSVTSSTLTTVSLAWGDVDYATRYLIERCCDLSPPFGWGTAGTVDDTGAATQTYTDRGLSCSTSYSFRVSTQGDGTNTASGYGNPSTPVTSATDACEPTVGISGLAGEIPIGSSDTFDVVMTHLDTATDYLLTLYTSNTDLGFDSSCTTTQQSVSLTNLTSSTETQAFVVHSCNAGTGVLTVILSGGGFTKSDYATVSPPTLDAPSGLTITPLPLRQALLSWSGVTGPGATVKYVVEAREYAFIGPQADWQTLTNTPLSDSELFITLDSVIGSRGLADSSAFQFQVKATDSGGGYFDSAFSAIIATDSPLLLPMGRAYGTSTNDTLTGGGAILQWQDIPAAQGRYAIRYRKLASSPHHSLDDPLWQLTVPEPNDWNNTNVSITTVLGGVSSATITGLQPRELYAIQLNYETNSDSVYSARTAYVWPSDERPGPDNAFPSQGSRVATFPYFGHWPGPDPEYAPVICRNTFYPEDEREAWVDLIIHASEQWEIATGNAITVSPTADDCDDLDSITPIDVLKSILRLTSPAFILDGVAGFWGALAEWIANFLGVGSEIPPAARIYMVDTTGWDQVVDYVEVLQNPLSSCVYFDRACVISPVGYTTLGQSANLRLGANTYGPIDVAVDMLINEGAVYENNRTTDLPESVNFNTCMGSDTNNYGNYATIVHEIGHALGISGFSTGFAGLPDYETAHPTVATAVMNRDSQIRKRIALYPDEPDCAPHPWDILAIHALYQVDIP